MLYAQLGYKDLKEYCIKELKYSEGSAWRKISAMKLLVEIPEMESKIESGDLNLTQISMARAHFREMKTSQEEKKEILVSLENQSTRSTERILAELKPEELNSRPLVSEKPVKGSRVEINMLLDEELLNQLEEIQILTSKSLTKLELFKLLTKDKLEQLRKQQLKALQKPRRKTTSKQESLYRGPAIQSSMSQESMSLFSTSQDSTNQGSKSRQTTYKSSRKPERIAQPAQNETATKRENQAKPTRRIAKVTLRQVQIRDQHRCQYRDLVTSRQCEAKMNLQMEHINPFAKGGGNEIDNIQLLCPNHNRLRAVEQYGINKMKEFFSTLN